MNYGEKLMDSRQIIIYLKKKRQRRNNAMKKSVFHFIFLVFICVFPVQKFWAQGELNPNILTFDAYLGYIKQFHPTVKQANLDLNQAQAQILAARGGFDPKIEVDYVSKQFNQSEYYQVLNSTFKIPTWFGIEIKAAFEQADGLYLDADNIFPASGLATLGITVPVGQGLIINKRMADLRKAKLYQNLTVAERDLAIADVLFDAILAYFDWYRSQQEYNLYETFLSNATVRFQGIRGLIREGDRPAIDSIEAGILVKNRRLGLEQARMKLIKSKLELSNFLWLNNETPLELQESILPEPALETNIESVLQTNGLLIETMDLAMHPKIRALENKVNILDVERRVKGDLLKPRLDLNYNYLSEPTFLRDFNVVNYKYGLNFSLPVFLRKERGEFKIAKFRVRDAELDLLLENQVLRNKIDFQLQEISSLDLQLDLANQLLADFQTMLQAEERLFLFGESSIFLINTRENSLLSSSMQQLDMKIRFCQSHAKLYQILARPQ